jgi:ribosomal protein S18 acetylase RimI-like enzyme
MEAFASLLAESAGTPIAVGGARGGLFPFDQDSTFLSSVVVPPGADLELIVAELGRQYPPGRVRLWITEEDVRNAESFGLKLVARVPAMSARLEGPDELTTGPHRVAPRDVGGLNDLVYGFRDERLARIFTALPEEKVRAYGLASADGELLSGALAFDVESDCSVEYVATHPSAQRRGYATSVLRCLLADAFARGCSTSSLRASTQGAPLYAGLGYGTVAHLEVRTAVPA